MERKHHINFWYIIIAFSIVMLIQSYWASSQHIETIPYSKFEETRRKGANAQSAPGRTRWVACNASSRELSRKLAALHRCGNCSSGHESGKPLAFTSGPHRTVSPTYRT
jgi:hypothetical protein